MKFSIDRELIHKELQRANRVVPVRSTLPILTCVLLSVKDLRLKISATDIEITFVSEMEVNNSSDGSVAVPSKVLNDIIGVLPQGEISVSSDDKQNVQIECSSGRYSIAGRSPEDFPATPNLEDEEQIDIDNDTFSRIVEKTVFAVSADMLRPALTGVLFEFNGNGLTTVATDGHRLAKLSSKKLSASKMSSGVIIPKKFLNLILNSLANGDENKFYISENHAMVTIGD